MAYEPNVWKCGDTITADQLNRLEQAVAELSQGGDESGALVIKRSTTQDVEGYILYDKTWQEVADAIDNGQPVTLVDEIGSEVYINYPIKVVDGVTPLGVSFAPNDYEVSSERLDLEAPTADDYLRIPTGYA